VGEVTDDEGLRLRWVSEVGKDTKGNIQSAGELVEETLGTPRGLRWSGTEDPFEEELVEPHSQKVGVGVEEGRVVPVEVGIWVAIKD